MHVKDAKALLGLPPEATLHQVKEAYKKKALECHPDLFPAAHKLEAERSFKEISEAYACLSKARYSGSFYPIGAYADGTRSPPAGLVRKGSRTYYALAALPFVALIFCTVSLGAYRAKRAYQKQKKDSAPHHPFLP